MKYFGSTNRNELRLYREYLDIIEELENRRVHISNAKDLARYIRENHLENEFTFTHGFEQFCKDAALGYYEDNVRTGTNMITTGEFLQKQYGVGTFRELVKLIDEKGLPSDLQDPDVFVEGSYDKFKQAVEAGYYDYDVEKWMDEPTTTSEYLQHNYGVSSYRELIARVDREGFTAVYGNARIDFPEGSYESFRRAVLAGKYDE